MSAWGWVVLGLVCGVLAWLALALTGAVREVRDLRARVEALESSSEATDVRLADGLPVGSPSPGWSVTAPDGSTVTSAGWRGRRHLVLFADAGCVACVELLPEVVGAAADALVPPTVVIGRGPAPPAWVEHADGVRVVVGVEDDGAVSRAFRTEISPHVFVVDEGGFIVAQGGSVTLEDVHALVREAGSLTIVAGSSDD